MLCPGTGPYDVLHWEFFNGEAIFTDQNTTRIRWIFRRIPKETSGSDLGSTDGISRGSYVRTPGGIFRKIYGGKFTKIPNENAGVTLTLDGTLNVLSGFFFDLLNLAFQRKNKH